MCRRSVDMFAFSCFPARLSDAREVVNAADDHPFVDRYAIGWEVLAQPHAAVLMWTALERQRLSALS